MSLLAYLLAFFIGCTPAGVIIGKARGVDVRKGGSGNIGATNVSRLLGKKAGLLTLCFDVFKGIAATYLIPSIFPETSPAVAGALAVLGHCFSIFLKFKGGKGVATSFGYLIVLLPSQAVLAISVFVIFFWFFRYVSLSSIAASTAIAGINLYLLLCQIYSLQGLSSTEPLSSLDITVLPMLVALLVIFKHQSNIQRLLQHQEEKWISKKNGRSSD